jgi:hypothetical protein
MPDATEIDDRRPVAVHVSDCGNRFMTDIASWIVEACAENGRRARLVADGRLPEDAGTINLVVAPHEFYFLSDADDRAIDRAISISAPVCTEQPGTRWFEMTSLVAARSPVVFDINAHGVEALRQRGHDAHHLRLGAVPSLDRRGGRTGERDLDVVFLGGQTQHRAERLADLADLLGDRHSQIRLFSASRPVDESTPGLVFGGDKYDLLARSRILLNIHRDSGGDGGAGYFEWARMVEAMANGVAVLTEPASGYEPLTAGEHFVMTDDLRGELQRLLGDQNETARVGAAAAEAVEGRLSLVESIRPVLELLGGVFAHRTAHAASGRIPRYRAELLRAQQIPLLPAFRPNRDLRRRLLDAYVGEIDVQRRIDRVRCRARHGLDDHVDRSTSATYEMAEPEVSVVVTLFDYGHLVTETLDSIAESGGVDLEIVVIDDRSRDDSRDVVRSFIDRRGTEVPILLLESAINRGLPASRNLAIRECRASKVMVMDADNLVRPNCLHRLAAALDADPGAAFAYSILEEFGERTGVKSALAWHVPWLCDSNYIDAQAMLRVDVWREVGGFREDDLRIYGWEDWDLWLRLAEEGRRGVLVPEMLGRYRTQAESMITTSNLFGDVMLEHLEARYPDLPWPRR